MLAVVILVLSILLHELSHIAAGAILGFEVKGIKISPLGLKAFIKTGNEPGKKLILSLAGPVANFFLAGLALRLPSLAKYSDIANINIYLGFFNLIPIYPLDGGRVLHIILTRLTDFIVANRITIKTGKCICIVLIIVGLVQAVLFPLNISIFCIAFFLLRNLDEEYIHLTTEFYKLILLPSGNKLLPAKVIAATSDTPIHSLIDKMSPGRYLCVYLTDKQMFIGQNTILKIMTGENRS